MKKILIFYGSYGGGHLSAARSIKEYIDTNYSNIETNLVDCVECINKFLNKISTKAYSDMAKHAPWAWKRVYSSSEKGSLSHISNTANRIMSIKLLKIIQNFAPDLIISTHPFSSQMCSVLKKKNKLYCKIATVMTDYAPHSQWLVNSDYIDYYFVAHSGMKESLISSGVSESKIYATGIPLSNRFLLHYDKKQILSEFGLKENKTTILFFAGGAFGLGKAKTYEILQSFIDIFPDFQIVAISGKNEKMKKRFDELVETTHSSDTVKILEYTNKVPELMSVSDLVITKPGGLTTTESLASGLPIIIINPIPGQEEENAKFLEEKQVAIWLKKEDNPKEVLMNLFNNKEKIKRMKINARLLAKRNSTKDICEILLNNKETDMTT